LPDSTSILHTEALSIGYKKGKGTKPILENITVSITKGQLICMLGPNGVGKTTLMRTLSRVQEPLSGEIWLDNIRLKEYGKRDLAMKLSLVLTERIQAGNLTVYELVSLGRFPHTDWTGRLKENDRRAIASAIELCHIEYIQQEFVHELSDGQLQKAMIARALAQDGELLMMDEPTAHLDANNRYTVMKLLKNLVKETGKTIFISTHNVEIAQRVADQLWLMNCGTPIKAGDPKTLYQSGDIQQLFPFLEEDY
jgi:iron complex transport system ATP-binding protein